MTNIKRLAALFAVALLGIFAFQNQDFLFKSGELKIFTYHASMPFGIWLILSFVVGGGLILIIDMPRALLQKRELKRKSAELARVQFELGRYQNAGPAPENPGIASAAANWTSPPANQNLEKRLGL